MGVLWTLGVLQPALVCQKRRRLGKQETKGAEGGIVDGVSRVRTLLTMVRQVSGPSVYEALEDIEASGSGHDDLLGSMASVTVTIAMSIGNRKPLAGQN